jgi:hypothetical protein
MLLLMLQRFQAMMLLLVMGWMLPRAGTSLTWCLHEQRLMTAGERCVAAALASEHRGCGCEQDEERPACMVEAGKLIPDGVASAGVSLPPPWWVAVAPEGFRASQIGAALLVAGLPSIPRAPPPPGCPRFLRLGMVKC